MDELDIICSRYKELTGKECKKCSKKAVSLERSEKQLLEEIQEAKIERKGKKRVAYLQNQLRKLNRQKQAKLLDDTYNQNNPEALKR